MVDIHTHILPHVDDGARSSEMAVKMLEMEKAEGVTSVVFTPHYYVKRSPESFLEKRNAAFERIQDKIPEGLDVHLGAEVHFTGINVPDFDELCTLAIGDTKYILLEFPFTGDWPNVLLDTLADFIAETGYTPIVAHVERYVRVLKKPAIVSRLVEMGCLIQVNAESFYRKDSKKFVAALLKHGLIHCVGTDAHDLSNRPPEHQKVKAVVEKLGCLAEWEKIQKNMENVIRGGQVCVEIGTPVKKFLGKYF